MVAWPLEAVHAVSGRLPSAARGVWCSVDVVPLPGLGVPYRGRIFRFGYVPYRLTLRRCDICCTV